jgi:CHASE3 domain sensor protein
VLRDRESSARAVRFGPPLPPRPFAGFLVAILAVVLIAIFSYRSLEARSATAERVVHTFSVVEQLETLLSTLKDAETGQRGFLLTGVESYLKPYEKAKAELPAEFASLRGLLADSPERVNEFETVVKRVY